MPDLLIALASALVGVVASVVVSRYYFTRTVEKRLTPYLQFGAPVFGGMDPDVRRDLKIFYRDREVDDLYELQFAVVNDGDRSIRDCLEPLTLHLRSGLEVLDATVIRTHPDGRAIDPVEVVTSTTETQIRMPFPLLNRGEGFVVKMVLRGRLVQDDLRFTIAADDLPPVIDMQMQPSEDDEPDAAEYFLNLFRPALLVVMCLLSVYVGCLFLSLRAPVFGVTNAPINVPAVTWLVITWAACVLVALLYGIAMIVNVFTIRRRALNLAARDRMGLPRHFWQAPPPYVARWDIFEDDAASLNADRRQEQPKSEGGLTSR